MRKKLREIERIAALPIQNLNEDQKEKLRMVGEGAFHGCSSLTTVALPEGLQEVGENAFNGCSSLTAVQVPESATIGQGAFEGCSSLAADRLAELASRYEDDVEDGAW